ncbi:MAG: FkbM family methyltransferase [Pseudomonadota bacterium]
MSELETLTLDDGARIVVSTNPVGMTRFVLREQGQWFEPELPFLQQVVAAGARSIDVGANHGLYTVALGRASHPGGEVIAVEPTPATAACLRATIEANEMAAQVKELALSDAPGTATLHAYPNSEINTLGRAGIKPGAVEHEVTVSTLDQLMADLGWTSLDFLKLDAEGEEVPIVEGAAETLAGSDPLVLFELKHGGDLNLPLIRAFENAGYASYRLVPELGALLPFDPAARIDRFQLNLFCCKPSRAEALKAAGLLVSPAASAKLPQQAPELPWASGLTEPEGADREIFRACAVDADPRAGVEERWAGLNAVRAALAQKAGDQAGPMELAATASRAAFTVGERGLGVTLLGNLIRRLQGGEKFSPRHLYYPPARRFDHIPAPDDPRDWFVASALERYLKEHAFSTYFSRSNSAAMLRYLGELGFADDHLKRRADALAALQQTG